MYKEFMERVAELPIDLNGHFSKHYNSRVEEEIRRAIELTKLWQVLVPNPDLDMSYDEMESIFNGEFVQLKITGHVRYIQCPMCSTSFEDNIKLETDGTKIRLVGRCPNENGIECKFRLQVPSGKILVDDDLRYLCRTFSDWDINYPLNTRSAIEHYADMGVVVAFGIGNSCPSLFKHPDGSMTIERPHSDERHVPADSEELLTICTDLWAYSMIDLEEAEKRAEYYGVGLTGDVIEVEPGEYEFDHDLFGGPVFATIRRIGPAKEPLDFIRNDRSLNIHYLQAAQDNDFYIHQVLNHGIPVRDWHVNGFRMEAAYPGIADRIFSEMKPFVGKKFDSRTLYGLDVICERKECEMFGGVVNLNHSHAVAVGLALQNMIEYGFTDDNESSVKPTELYESLCDNYPRVKEDVECVLSRS